MELHITATCRAACGTAILRHSFTPTTVASIIPVSGFASFFPLRDDRLASRIFRSEHHASSLKSSRK